MKLDDQQKALVAQWIEQGSKLADIQTRLAAELGIKLTYMEVRMLVDDLKLVPKDLRPVLPPEPPANPQSPLTTKAVAPEEQLPPPAAPVAGFGSVSVSVDQIARPGALVSGKVKFSDNQTADWTLDQTGRLGLAAQQKGYRPIPADVEQFQVALQKELAKLGF